MKKFFSVLAFVFLSVVGVYGQQIDVSVGLPVGSNVDNRPMKVAVGIGNWDTGWGVEGSFQYEPTMGDFGTVINEHLSTIVANFNPPVGSENDQFVLGIVADSGPFATLRFKLQQSGSRWIVPPEVLEVELNYGKNTAWKIDGVTAVELEVHTPSGVRRFSSKDSTGGSVCFLGTQRGAFGEGWVLTENTYTLPWLQQEKGIYSGTISFYEGDRYAVFDLLDGSVVNYSDPPPAFLKFPELKLEIAKVADGLEFSVTGVGEKSFVIESSVDFVKWETYPTVELTSVGKKSFRSGVVTGSSRFFRLKIESATSLGR